MEVLRCPVSPDERQGFVVFQVHHDTIGPCQQVWSGCQNREFPPYVGYDPDFVSAREVSP